MRRFDSDPRLQILSGFSTKFMVSPPDLAKPELGTEADATWSRTPRPLLIAVATLAALNIAIFLIRSVSVLRYGSLFGTTGGECLMVYSIWKKMHGHAIYEWPLAKPFSLSLYNYLFYYSYAALFRLMGWWDAEILTTGRMLTAAFAGVGALAQWQLVGKKIRPLAQRYLCLVICLGLWYGTSIVRWWALTIRPDIPALALAMIALLCLGRVEGQRGAVLAAVFFYLAWSFKQSIALIAAASILYMLVTRRRSGLMMLGVCLAGVGATTLLGTPAYRYSVFVAPGVVPSFALGYAISSLEQPLITYSFVWIPLCFLAFRPWKRTFEIADLLRWAALLSLAGGCIAMGKAGAGDNYLFEFFAAGTTLLLVELFKNPGRRAVLLFFAMACVQPAVQLGGWMLGHESFGTVEIARPVEFEQARMEQQRILHLPKPLLTTDETMSLPWNSSGNAFPAYIFDQVFAEAAGNHYQEGGPIGLVERGAFPSLMLKTSDSDLVRAASLKYVLVGEETHQHFRYKVFLARREAK